MPWFDRPARRRELDRMTLLDVVKELQIVRVHTAATGSTVSTMNTEQAHQRYAAERVAQAVADQLDELAALRAELVALRGELAELLGRVDRRDG